MPDKISRRRERLDDVPAPSRPHETVERKPSTQGDHLADAVAFAAGGLGSTSLGGPQQIAMMQSLQRTAGNAAVERLVAQRAVAMAPAIALTNKDIDAIAEQVHTAIEGLGTDEEAVYSALEKLGKNQPMINKVKTSYKTQFKADLEGDIRGDFSGKECQLALELINIKHDPKKADLVGKVPATDPEYKAAARTLYAAMKGMGTDIEALYGVLMPFNRDKAKLDKLKAVYTAELAGGLTGKGLEEDIKDEWGLSKNEQSYALYLLNAPLPVANTGAVPRATAGAEAFKQKVPGGVASARTGVDPGFGSAQGYEIGFKGGLARETHWLQFIWREIEVTDPVRGKFRLSDVWHANVGDYSLTTDPANPVYNTDSLDHNNPFYEAAGASEVTNETMTMFDMPSDPSALVAREFAAGATHVAARAHFNTFMVRDYRVLEQTKVDVQWDHAGPATPPRTQSAKSAGKVSSLPKDMKKRLVQQYPRFSYIQ